MFDDIFDFDGDGKASLFEQIGGFMLLNELTEDNNQPRRTQVKHDTDFDDKDGDWDLEDDEEDDEDDWEDDDFDDEDDDE